MLPDMDKFGLYISLAFDHFSESLDRPFDYVQASLKHQPPPMTLADTLENFLLMIAAQLPEMRTRDLFKRVTLFVAPCLMLDSARKQRTGTAF